MTEKTNTVAAEKSGNEAPRAEKLSVDELARATGHLIIRKNPYPERVTPDAAHAAASALHGWKDHQHHAAAPMVMTRADYEAALKAAEAPPEGQRSLVPHRPALSPHCPHHFTG